MTRISQAAPGQRENRRCVHSGVMAKIAFIVSSASRGAGQRLPQKSSQDSAIRKDARKLPGAKSSAIAGASRRNNNILGYPGGAISSVYDASANLNSTTYWCSHSTPQPPKPPSLLPARTRLQHKWLTAGTRTAELASYGKAPGATQTW